MISRFISEYRQAGRQALYDTNLLLCLSYYMEERGAWDGAFHVFDRRDAFLPMAMLLSGGEISVMYFMTGDMMDDPYVGSIIR